jgi:hypothetical protein
MNVGAVPSIFFGYPGRPVQRVATLTEAMSKLRAANAAVPKSWQELRTGGRYLIDSIFEAIQECDVSAFDLSTINLNVLFELGYAIGGNRRIWLLRDKTLDSREWNTIQFLTTVAYSPYVSSDDILAQFYRQQPHLVQRTVYESSIANALTESSQASIFYLKALYDTDPELRISKRINEEARTGLKVVVADPREAALETLSWYAQQINGAGIVITHITEAEREGSGLHNARCAFVAGLAEGMGKPLLVLASDDYWSPVDYRDIVERYTSATNAYRAIDAWLDRHVPALRRHQPGAPTKQRSLTGDLRKLTIGDPVAENEADSLGGYFVQTASYGRLLTTDLSVFVGSKGTGKTANMMEAAAELIGDRRNLVVVIKPSAYELQAVVKLIAAFKEIDEQGYLIESLWKFLVYTEIAQAVFRAMQEEPAWSERWNSAEFEEFVRENEVLILEDFSVRLDAAVANALKVSVHKDTAASRAAIAERLHLAFIGQLVIKLRELISERHRLSIFVDNLDKAWTRANGLDELSEFVLGLLSVMERIQKELSRTSNQKDAVRVTLGVFLRADIFEAVRSQAREPDKLPITRLSWDDPALLLRVVEERYEAAVEDVSGSDFWSRVSCPTVDGLPVREYVALHTFHRPRDLIYLCRAALATAVNRSHTRIEPEDWLDAGRQYSQFAVEAMRVEVGYSHEIDECLYQLYGGRSHLTLSDLEKVTTKAKIPADKRGELIRQLVLMSCLGADVGQGIQYVRDGFDNSMFMRRVADLVRDAGTIAFELHPALRPYLEVA